MLRVSILLIFGVYVWCAIILAPNEIWAQSSDELFGNDVEGFVKDLFTKELSSAKHQNLTDCMTRLLCESICQRTAKGDIKGEPMLNSAKMLRRSETDPLGYFFTGGDKGYELGRSKQCHQCAAKYPNCLPGDYEHAKTISGQYENNMLKGAESSVDSDFASFD